jgi:hypothetical protein
MVPVARNVQSASSSSGGSKNKGSSAEGGKGGAGDGGGDDDDDDNKEQRGMQVVNADGSVQYLPPLPTPLDPEDALLGGGASSGGGNGAGAAGGGSALGGVGGGGAAAAGAGGLGLTLQQRQEQEIAPIVSYHNLVMVQRAIFLMFQGLLAGFCFTTLFTVEAAVRARLLMMCHL